MAKGIPGKKFAGAGSKSKDAAKIGGKGNEKTPKTYLGKKV